MGGQLGCGQYLPRWLEPLQQRARPLLWRETSTLAHRLEAERQQFLAQVVTPEAERGLGRFLKPQAERPGL